MENKNNLWILALITLIIVIFVVYMLIEFCASILEVICGTLILLTLIMLVVNEFAKYKRIGKSVKEIYWDEPDARKLQEAYECICKKYAEKIKETRKENILLKSFKLNVIGIPIILLAIYIKLLEITIILSFLYIAAQIAIIYFNQVKEEEIYSQILKEFIDTEYKFDYIAKSDEGDYYIIKKMFEEEYKKFEDGAYVWQSKDYVKGIASDNAQINIAQLNSKYSGSDMFNGTFIIVDKNTNMDIKILNKTTYNVNEEKYLYINHDKIIEYFRIYAKDENIAKSVLTVNLLDFISEFREKYQIEFEIVFKDKIYIKFYTKDLFYRDGMSAKNIDKFSAGQYYIVVKFVDELIKILNEI